MTVRSFSLPEELEVKLEEAEEEEVLEVPVIVPGQGVVGTTQGGGIE